MSTKKKSASSTPAKRAKAGAKTTTNVTKRSANANANAKANAKRAGARRSAPRASGTSNVTALRVREIDALREELETKRAALVPRWNADPEDVQKSVAQLVLALVEFLRKLLERQAIRRMEAETLAPEEVERIGVALMRLEETVHGLAAQFGLDPEELNLDLGPLGRLS
jgi:hypothetical protein